MANSRSRLGSRIRPRSRKKLLPSNIAPAPRESRAGSIKTMDGSAPRCGTKSAPIIGIFSMRAMTSIRMDMSNPWKPCLSPSKHGFHGFDISIRIEVMALIENIPMIGADFVPHLGAEPSIVFIDPALDSRGAGAMLLGNSFFLDLGRILDPSLDLEFAILKLGDVGTGRG